MPCLWDALRRDESWPGPRVSVCLHIYADGQDPRQAADTRVQSFTFEVAGSELTVREGGTDAPLASIRLDRSSWDLSVRHVLPRVLRHANGRREELHAALGAYARGRARRVNPTDLAKLPGRVELTYTDDAGDTGFYLFEVGSGAGPTAKILAEDADLWALVNSRGRLVPLVRTRTRLEGEVGYLLRLAAFFERGHL